MKKRFTILAAAFALLAFLAIPMGMRGQTRDVETFTFSDLGFANADDVTVVEGDNVTLTFAQGTNATNAPKYYTSGTAVRMYTGNTLEVALNNQEGETRITAISFTFVSSSYAGSLQNWTGSETSVSFTNTASSQARIQEIAVTFSEGGTPTPTTYTVTYNCNGGTSGCPENVTGIEAGTQIQLAAAPTKTDCTFDGWSDGGTTYQAGANYTVNGNVTFTAQWTEIVSGDEQWVLTNLADLTASDVFVIVSTKGTANYAMSNDKGASAAPTAVSVTVANDQITSNVASTIQWTGITGNATDGYTIYSNADNTKYLYCINNNNGVRVGSGDDNTFIIKDNYIYNNGQGRYIGVYNNADWRCYTTIHANIQGQTFAFYKKVTGGVIPPSITAANVDIAYNATSGSIAYTINNGVTGGTMSVATESDWLTLGQGTSSPISFTCSANSAGTDRTATVTLTYTYNRATVTANVIVTQAGNPDATMTIAEVRAQGTGEVATLGTVTSITGTSNKTAYIQDATAAIVVYGNFTAAVGDEIRVSGTLSTYHGLLEITSPQVTVVSSGNSVTPIVKTIAEINADDYTSSTSIQGLYVTIENATVTVIDGQNTTIAQGDNTIVVRGISSDVTYALNDILTLDGNIGCFDAAQIANPQNVTVQANTDPAITVNPATINAPAEGENGTLTVTYENFTPSVINVYFCNAEGVSATYDWIVAEINDDDDVDYIIYPNEGAERMAYLKVVNVGDAETYSNLVTINQETAPTVATLPFTYDGNGLGELPDGLTQHGLTGKYDNSPKMKFDDTDDWLLLHFDGTPGILTFDIKGNPSNGVWAGTFKVQTSEDGVTYSDLESYTELENTVQHESFSDLGANVRYIKWVFTEKVSGNVALGNIVLQPYVAPQEYTLTVGSLSNVELFVFDASNESQAIIEGEGSAQVLNGTTIEISVSAMDGYVLQSLMVDGLDVTSQIDETGAYTFTMPTHDVTITATAVEIIAPTDDVYVRITSLNQLTDGSIVVIASRYNEDATNYYAMKNTISGGKAQCEAFVSTTSDGNEILPASIVDNVNDYYWVVNLTENGYTFTNANGDVISYNSSSNFNMNGTKMTWNVERGTSGEALVPSYEGFKITNVDVETRCIAFRNTETGVFGPFSTQNINGDEYNFFLDFFVQTAGSETVTQTIELTAGWNWISTYIEMDPVELLEMLEEQLGENAIQIKSQTLATAWDEDEEEWSGRLQNTGLTSDKTYMIQMMTDATVTLVGPASTPEGYTITINPGWNWIGFPSAEPMDVNEALADFEAVDGDELKTRTLATAWDEDEEEWSGRLITLIPGQGFLFKSASDEVRYLNYNSGSSKKQAALQNNNSLNNSSLNRTKKVQVFELRLNNSLKNTNTIEGKINLKNTNLRSSNPLKSIINKK